MKPKWILWLLLLAVACKDNGPSAPATPASLNLAGTWAGTVTFAASPCPAETITTTVSQFGTYVSVPTKTHCYGSVNFAGNITGNQLAGTVNHTCFDGDGYVSSGVQSPISEPPTGAS